MPRANRAWAVVLLLSACEATPKVASSPAPTSAPSPERDEVSVRAESRRRVRALIEASLHEARPVSEPEAATVPQLSRVPLQTRLGHGVLSSLWEHQDPMGYRLLLSNHEVFDTLQRLDRTLVAAVLERRMLGETSSESMELVLAGVAASAGSRRGALQLLESLERTEYWLAYDTQSVIGHLVNQLAPSPPAWSVELALLALADDRFATALNENAPTDAPIRPAETRIRLSEMATEDTRLALALAEAKATSAVPFLLQRLERAGRCNRFLLHALAKLEDRAAIPSLLRCLTGGLAHESDREHGLGRLSPSLGAALDGLSAMKVAEAVPPLLDHLESVEVIDALDRHADARATKPLEALVAAGGRIRRDGRELQPERAAERIVAAQIALVRLASEDPARGYCTLLADLSLDQYQRLTVARRMHELRDPKVIPCLARALQSDATGTVGGSAIEGLADFPHAAAVEALIAGLDVDFEGKSYLRTLYRPAMFHDAIAKSLGKLTGKSLGTTSAAWRRWWRREGQEAFVEGRALAQP